MGLGAHIIFTVHQPLKLATFTDKEALIKDIESTITANIHP
jgi:1-acyl-sn-glycerol-3-phosphate acyltransferase